VLCVHYDILYTIRLFRIISDVTIDRLSEIYDLTKLPLLVIAEGADISTTLFDSLVNQAFNRHLPIVFLLVLRRFERIKEQDSIFFVFLSEQPSTRRIYKDSTLSC